MLKKRLICALLLAALLMALPTGALAARRPSVKFPVKLGLVTVGDEVTLKPKVKRASAADLVWESSDETVAQVWSGKLTALKAGTTVISASIGRAKAKCGLVVLPKSVQVGVNESFRLPRGGRERYAIRDKTVATVSKKGVVTGVRTGQTQLLVKCGKQKLVLDVTVGAAGTAAEALSLQADIGQAEQVVLVEYTGNSKATLTLCQKQSGSWKAVHTCKAYVGKNGIGKTVAGDKKTPEGVYNLTTPFGIKDDPGSAMPYTKVTKYHYWCGDSSSRYYNQLVDERTADRKHTSADEYLIRYRGCYNYCLFIDYNAQGEPGKGSCIFLHCMGSKKSTSGCVAIAEADMIKVLKWAKAGTKIVIRNQQG